MQDRPTAQELLHAAREFCERDLIPQLSGRVGFHARVLNNVLKILEREWATEEEAVRREWGRLRQLLEADATDPPVSFAATRDQVRAWNSELSSRIRSGEMDDRFDETLIAVKATVDEKLGIANPRYAEGSGAQASSEA